ncbi:hypothetical protein [Leptospira noguchii]|uniref:hypothetical protein n=1 Tax=Leptospira noguchii TaxID=28182 RepID=UPI0002F6632D|nr:hypothetical protein [Leptospira noguchii]AGS80628.1 hypothetical protein LEP1GSC059_0021 [Leptospira phage vB_LnoZ_CZ214-LE1]
MDIKKIKKTLENIRSELTLYIKNSGSYRETEALTDYIYNYGLIAKYVTGKKIAKIETLINIVEIIVKNQKLNSINPNIDIQKIKKTVENIRLELTLYIKNSGSYIEIEALTDHEYNNSQISKYINGKLTAKFETLIGIVEKIEKNKK